MNSNSHNKPARVLSLGRVAEHLLHLHVDRAVLRSCRNS